MLFIEFGANKISYDIKDKQFLLPDVQNISNNMIEQLDRIKANNYMLPSVHDMKLIESYNKKPAVIFDETIKNNTGKYSWE